MRACGVEEGKLTEQNREGEYVKLNSFAGKNCLLHNSSSRRVSDQLVC